MKLLNRIKEASPATSEELGLAYQIRERARMLGPLSQELYGNDADIVLDEEALIAACIEMIRSIRAGEC